MADSLADLFVSLTADTSDFQKELSAASDQLDAVGASAIQAGSQVDQLGNAIDSLAGGQLSSLAQQFDGAASSVTEASSQLDLFGTALDGVPFSDATGQLNIFTDELEQFPGAASAATASLHDLSDAQSEVADSAKEAESALGSIQEQLLEFGEALAITEGLHEFGVEALQTFGAVQQASIALTALTGSAEQTESTIASLKTLSIDTATSFESLVSATQSMTAKFNDAGISSGQIHDALQAAADAAAATGGSFDRADSSLERMVLSGTAGARQLASLGISLNALGDQLNTTATGAAAAFKALDPTARLAALVAALGKYAGVAAQTAQGIIGQWQNLKTQTEFVFEGVGEALAPVVGQLLGLVSSDVIPFVQSLVDDFKALPEPAKDAAVALGLIVGALAPLAVGAAGFGLLVTGLEAAAPALAAISVTLAPFLPFVTGIGIVLGALQLSGAIGAIIDLGKAIDDNFGKVNWLATFFSAAFEPITLTIGAIRDVTSALGPLNSVVSSGATGFKSFADMAIAPWTLLRDVINDIKSAVQYIGGDQAFLKVIGGSNLMIPLTTGASGFGVIPDNVQSGPQGAAPAAPALTAAQISALQAAAQQQAKAELDALLAQMQGPLQGGAGASSGPMLAPGTGITPDEFDAMDQAALSMRDMQIDAAALSGDLEDAEGAEEDAYDTAQKLRLEYQAMPGYIDAVKEAWDASNAGGAAQAAADAQKLSDAFATLHISATDASKFMVTSFETIAESANTTLPQVEAAWAAVSGAISKLSKNDLPAAVAAYNDYIDALNRTGAPLGQILTADEALLALEIKMATERGQDATAFIEQLQDEKLAGQALTEQSQALGNVYVSLTNEFNGAFTALGKGIADNIIDAKNWGQAFGSIIDTIEKQILETLIGYGFKQLALAIQSSTNLMGGLAKVITDVMSGNFSGALADLKTIGPGQNPASIYSSPIGPQPATALPPDLDSVIGTNTAAINSLTTDTASAALADGTNTAAEQANTTAIGLLTAAIIALTVTTGVNAVTGVMGLLNKAPTGGVTSTIGPVQPGDENGTPVQPAGVGFGVGQPGDFNPAANLLAAALTANTGVIQIATTAQNIAAGNVIQMTSGLNNLTPQLSNVSETFQPIGGDLQDLGTGITGNTAAILPDTAAVTDNSSALGSLTGDLGGLTKDLGGAIPGAGGGGSLPTGGSGAVTGSGETAGEGSAIPGAVDNSSGETGAVGAAGGGSSALGSLSSLGSLGSIAGGIASIGAGITAGIQAEHANNLLDEIEKSTRGELNQTEDIQNTLNLYLPNLLHLVDIWGAIQQLGANAISAAMVASPSGDSAASLGIPQYPTSATGIPLVTVTDSSGTPIDPATTTDVTTAAASPKTSSTGSRLIPDPTQPTADSAATADNTSAVLTQADAIKALTSAIPAADYLQGGVNGGAPPLVAATWQAIETSPLSAAQLASAPQNGTPGAAPGPPVLGPLDYTPTLTYQGSGTPYGPAGGAGPVDTAGIQSTLNAEQSAYSAGVAAYLQQTQAAAQATAALAAAQQQYTDSVNKANLALDTKTLPSAGTGATIQANPNADITSYEYEAALQLARMMAAPTLASSEPSSIDPVDEAALDKAAGIAAAQAYAGTAAGTTALFQNPVTNPAGPFNPFSYVPSSTPSMSNYSFPSSNPTASSYSPGTIVNNTNLNVTAANNTSRAIASGIVAGIRQMTGASFR